MCDTSSSNLPEIITVQQVADLLQINERTVRELFHEGVIPGGRKVGKKLFRFHRDTVIEWLSGQACGSRSRRTR